MQEIHPVSNSPGLASFMKGKLVYKSAEVVFEQMWASRHGNRCPQCRCRCGSTACVGNWALWRGVGTFSKKVQEVLETEMALGEWTGQPVTERCSACRWSGTRRWIEGVVSRRRCWAAVGSEGPWTLLVAPVGHPSGALGGCRSLLPSPMLFRLVLDQLLT